MIEKKKPVQMQVTVTLKPEAYEFLEKEAKNGDLSGTLGGWCSYYVERQARGGLFLEPEDHDYCASLCDGRRFPDSRSLVRAIEKSVNRVDGQYTYPVNIDPQYNEPINELARQSGMTPAELIQNNNAMILSSNWLYDLTPVNGRMLPFSAKELELIAAARGKRPGYVDSTDIYALIDLGIAAQSQQKQAA